MHAAAMQPALGLSSLLFDGETVTIESLNAVSHLEQPAFTHLITHR